MLLGTGDKTEKNMATVYFDFANQNGAGAKISGTLTLAEDGIKIVKDARAAQAAFGLLGAALAGKGDTATIYYRDIAAAAKGDEATFKNGVVLLRSCAASMVP